MTGPSFPPAARMAVLLSGGVDSAVAASLLRDAGPHVEAVTLLLHGGEDAESARRLAGKMGIPWTLLDLRPQFRARVLGPFARACQEGRTPNPCVACNPGLKLGLAAERVRIERGIGHLATGHYARLVRDGQGTTRLARPMDLARDQSYFLYRIPPVQLPALCFPLGDRPGKPWARSYAHALGLPCAGKPDSMDLCFLPRGGLPAWLAAYAESVNPKTMRPGGIYDTAGKRLGTHGGIAFYTVGQRKKLGAYREPLYVVSINAMENRVIIGPRHEASRREVAAIRPVFHMALAEGGRAWGRLRSGAEPAPCVVTEAREGRLAVLFDVPLFAPAPGQHLVLYDAEGLVMGGGEIN